VAGYFQVRTDWVLARAQQAQAQAHLASAELQE